MKTETLRSLAARKGLLIGTACGHDTFLKDPAYAAVLAREFNCIVAENSMKLEAIQKVRGEFDFSQTTAMMDFAARHDMRVRAVPLVWHEALPDWALGKTFPRQEALDILREHITTVMQYYKGRVFAWDVLNEALNDKGLGLRPEGPWYHSIGPDYIELVYRMAHEADPDAKLFYNDYSMDGMCEKSDRCYKMITELLARDVPIHGIGLQYHCNYKLHPTREQATENIRRFNDLGLAVHITELDVWVPREHTEEDFQIQAEVYRGVIESVRAASNCPVIVLWGFTDRYSWVPGISGGTYGHALPFDEDMRPKPAYEALLSALRE